MKKIYLFLISIFLFCNVFSQNSKCSIIWDNTSAKKVCDGVYGRIKKLNTGNLALVYSKGNSVYFKNSRDKGNSWDNEVFVAGNNPDYNYTNSELLQLSNGWLLYCWNARVVKQNGNCNYSIMYSFSYDYGKTWEKEKTIFKAGNNFKDGCWEPIALELPDGSIQIFFANEAPYTTSDEQEITMIESKDKCKTWNAPKTISFRKGHRDGMPVVVYLKESKTIAMAIEDNGIDGYFKPVVISMKPGWTELPVGEDREERELCLKGNEKLDSNIYAGAPYIIKASKDISLLSIQSTEGRSGNNEKHAIMQVYVGDSDCKNFTNKSTPFTNIPSEANALWNSLCLIENNKVIAVSSFANNPKGNGIWTVVGTLTFTE